MVGGMVFLAGGGQMDFKDVAGLALDEYWAKLEKAVDGLDDEEIRWQPSPKSNHILWLVWHCARVEDGWMAYLREVPESREVWNTEGWPERFGLSETATGYGDSAADIAEFPEVPVSLALDYFRSVRQMIREFLGTLTSEDLPLKHTDQNTSETGPTTAWTLAHLLVELSEHLGQIEYLRGMRRGLDG